MSTKEPKEKPKAVKESKVIKEHKEKAQESLEKWKDMGKPQQVSEEEYKKLEQSGQLQLYTSPEWKEADKGILQLKFELPRQGVSLIQLTW